jgi:hypothetical protein
MKVTDDAAARQRGSLALNDFIKAAMQPGQVVNKDVENAGIPSGQSVTVAIPKDALCPGGAFYGAVRIYVLNAEFNAFEAVLNPVSQTRRYPGWDYTKYSPCTGCWVGIAGAGDTPPLAGSDYGDDIPGQLLEYTIISQDPATGLDFPMPTATVAATPRFRCHASTTRTFLHHGSRRWRHTQFMGAVGPNAITARGSPNSFRRETGRSMGISRR